VKYVYFGSNKTPIQKQESIICKQSEKIVLEFYRFYKYVYISGDLMMMMMMIPANVDVNNLMRKYTTSYQHAQYWQNKQYIKRHNKVCAQLHFNIREKIRVKLDT
jgi:hypothetical protein